MHVDQPRHHEPGGMIDQPVARFARRRRRLGADEGEPAAAVEHQHLAASWLVFGAGEQGAASHKGFHRHLPTASDTRNGIVVDFASENAVILCPESGFAKAGQLRARRMSPHFAKFIGYCWCFGRNQGVLN